MKCSGDIERCFAAHTNVCVCACILQQYMVVITSLGGLVADQMR